MNWKKLLFLNFCLILGLTKAGADDLTQKTPKEDRSSFNLYVENDTRNLGGPGSDNNYTNGIRFSILYAPNEEPDWAKYFPWIDRLFKDHSFNFSLGLGQQIYTPEDIGRTEASLGDRPYGGWLYLSPSFNVVKEQAVDTFGLDIGIIGPQAFGGEVQRIFHRMIGARLPMGWDHQLGTEMGVVLSYQRKYRFLEINRGDGWKIFDTIPYFGAGLGNVYTGANVGGLFRFGYNISSDFGPARPSGQDGDPVIQTKGITDLAKQRNWEYYVFGGAKGSVVGHNIFLDGNTFQDTGHVTRVPFLLEYEGGFFIQFKNLSLTWRQVTRTPEFYELFKPHTFASVGISYGRRF